MSLTEDISNEEALRVKLQTNLPHYVEKIRTDAGPLEGNFIKAGQYLKSSALLFFGPLIVVKVLSELSGPFTFPDTITLVACIAAVLVPMCWGIVYFKKSLALRNNFALVVNDLMYINALTLLGLTGTHFRQSFTPSKATKLFLRQSQITQPPERQQVLSLLDHSELVTETRNTFLIDDLLTLTIGGKPLFVSEIDISNVTGTGKNRHTKKIFHGYFAVLDLSKTLSGKTFISTEGDEDGFGHLSFWPSLTKKEVTETILEWNEFEQLLHVATSDPVEARYILTPDFMHHLYDWWLPNKGNIRLSFVDTRLYILFPDPGVRIYGTIKKISDEEIKDFIYSIAKPLLHVVHLVEDVQRRFI